MEEQRFVFQIDHPLVQKTYNNEPNYLIEFSDNLQINNDRYCIIYFSSNDIYFPNTPESFDKQLLKKNRFEWYGTRILRGSKHIFLRDVFKQWYLKGINQKLCTVEKVLEWLKEETIGYKIVTLGSSAGGYAAVLFGQLLNAETTLSFNGQFTLTNLLKTTTELINPILFRESGNSNISRYFDITNNIQNPEIIFYFYSKHSKWDIEQYESVQQKNLHKIAFRTNHHGIPFLKTSLPMVLNMKLSSLIKYTLKPQFPLIFSGKLEGYLSAIINLNILVINSVIKRFNRSKFN
jgi:hypothetical protein